MRKLDKATVIITMLLSIIIFWLANRMVHLYMLQQGDIPTRVTLTAEKFIPSLATVPFFISLEERAIVAGLIGVILPVLWMFHDLIKRKNYRFGEEHGSAEWGSNSDIKPFKDKDSEQNILLTKTEGLSINTRKTLRNNNVCVIGGAGAGKTRYFVKPNLMQLHCSYVITSSKGVELGETGQMFLDNGYKLKVLNLKDWKGHCYNPFAYIKSDEDILRLVDNIMINTNNEGKRSTADGGFWEKAERMLLLALFTFVHEEGQPSERNIQTVCHLMTLAEAKEEDEDYKSALDFVMEEVSEDSLTFYYYNQYKLASGKTAKSILVSVAARLIPFNLPKVKKLLAKDELELDKLGEEKTVLYVVIPDTNDTFNFIAAMMYQQLFEINITKADEEYNGRLPIHIRCLLDEFANTGQIPQFDKLIATIRSREISVNVILQNLSQLKNLYKDTWETIVGNCDSFLFLGGKEPATLELVSKMVGTTTIDMRTTSTSHGKDRSATLGEQVISRSLITESEIGLLKTDECILSIRGVMPFLSKKYDIKKHERYEQLSDFNPENHFVFNKDQHEEVQIETIKEIYILEGEE